MGGKEGRSGEISGAKFSGIKNISLKWFLS